MTIGELAQRFGLRPSALRFYERNELLEPPLRAGGKRVYESGAVTRLAFIRKAQESGLTLAEIKAMIRDGTAGAAPQRLWQKAATAKLTVIDRRIAALHASRAALERKLACRCRTLAQCERMLAKETLGSVGDQLPGAK
ncbi:MAG: MerR family transcriptional regulator [Verrucomicrobiota bacterium]|nr:MerR family transcriptional regulator [Verrucomicrobiota bacterium]